MTQAVVSSRIYLDLYLFQTKSDKILLNNMNLLITKWVCKIYISIQLHVLEPLKMLWARECMICISLKRNSCTRQLI
ncbi:hypothetical protein LSH36_241g02004 [Paralvinella palmiformis]|uniref:Uncharacterized protein n=1 Tax=Paralvinella palmiformis TaxID=53620 RepID=A0AAD9N343_9ANNE|nr:hypothetical protein LSH36_241g02004 [Paralvinella palmiformis]